MSEQRRGVLGPSDVELFAVARGLKPAARSTVSPAELDAYTARLTARGYAWVTAARPSMLPGRELQAVVYVARRREIALAARDAEAAVLPGEAPRSLDDEARAAHRELGRLLGYPPCCVDAFVTRLERGVTRALDGSSGSEDFVAAEDALGRSEALRGRLNNLLFSRGFGLVSFYPCRYDCADALLRADAIFGALSAAARDMARSLEAGLCQRLWLARDGARGVGDGPAPDGALRLDFTAF